MGTLEFIMALLGTGVVSSIFTLWVEKMRLKSEETRQQKQLEVQERLEREKSESDELLKFSNAAKIQGETWEEIVEDLREEVARIKARAKEEGQSFLNEIERLKEALQHNRSDLENVMESERTKSVELENKLRSVTLENHQLRTQIVRLEGDNLRLQTELNTVNDEVQKVRLENNQLREALAVVNRRVDGIQKTVTGELKSRGGEAS